ncbi:MAG: hypothetical protein ABSA96_00660 [Candidatus Acidiferrales bacterium]
MSSRRPVLAVCRAMSILFRQQNTGKRTANFGIHPTLVTLLVWQALTSQMLDAFPIAYWRDRD